MPQSPLQIGTSLERLRAKPPGLTGRDQELATLRASVAAGRSVFVSGPSGVGKTALLHAVYGEWDACRAGFALFYCADSRTRRSIATHVLVNLFLNRGRLNSEYINRRKSVVSLAGLRRFVAQERVSDLKRMMHQNLERDRVGLLLDHLDNPDSRVAALIEVWLETTPLVLAARDADSAGRARWLLSACDHLPVRPLPASASTSLARTVAEGLGGARLSDADLHSAVVLAAGNPGRLQTLLRTAVLPAYRKRDAVQWKLVDLDLRIRAAGLAPRGGAGRQTG
jgi:hypothetical protein